MVKWVCAWCHLAVFSHRLSLSKPQAGDSGSTTPEPIWTLRARENMHLVIISTQPKCRAIALPCCLAAHMRDMSWVRWAFKMSRMQTDQSKRFFTCEHRIGCISDSGLV